LVRELPRHSKVGELNVTRGREKDIRRFDVAMDLALAMQILETLQQLAENDSNEALFQGSRLHLARVSEHCEVGGRKDRRTRSRTEPPARNSMIIHNCVPFKYEP
jgi:hypothetical protein